MLLPAFRYREDGMSYESIVLLAYFCILAETFVLLLLIPVSTYTLRAVCRTSLLHWNLKVLYVCQMISGAAFYAPGRIYSMVTTWWLMAEKSWSYGMGSTVLVRAGPMFAITLTTYLTPMLICERMVATRMARTYEQSRRHYPVLACVLVVVALSGLQTANGVTMGKNITPQLLVLGG